MKAAILRATGEPLTIEEIGAPRLAAGQVLVRMQLAAVCQSQRLEVSGGRGLDRFLPHLIGHEGVGVVEEIGPGVAKVRPGDQVVLSWIRGSGLDGGPVRYSSSRGDINAGPIATFCETPVVSEQCVTRIFPAVDPEMAVLAGCALPTGAGAVLHAATPEPAGSICIIGAGGVGLAAASGAVLAGWPTIAVMDMRPSRLARAQQLGATHLIDVRADDVDAAVTQATAGNGFDLVIECAGVARAMEMAVRIAKPRGGRIVIVGNLAAGGTFAVDPMDLIRGRELSGSWGGGVSPDADIPQFIQGIVSGAIDHRLLLGRRFRFDEINEALNALDGEEAGRPIVDCRTASPAFAFKPSAASRARSGT